MVLTEFIHNAIKKFQGVAVFAGIGERSREGLELWEELPARVHEPNRDGVWSNEGAARCPLYRGSGGFVSG